MKICDRGLENAAEAAGVRQHFQARGQFFTIRTVPTLNRQITCMYLFFPAVNWLTKGFVYATLSLNRLQTIVKNLTRIKEQIYFGLLYEEIR